MMKKIGTIQILGFQRKNFLKSLIFLIPVVAVGIATVLFTIFAAKRLGIEYYPQNLASNLPGVFASLFETVFLQEIFIVGFLSALHHRYSKTQWKAVIFALLVSVLSCMVQLLFGSGIEYKQILFQLFVNAILALCWIKYRNQNIFLTYLLSINCYTFLLLSMNTSGAYIIITDALYTKQIEYSMLIGIFLFAATTVFMVLTLKYPIPKMRIAYSKEIIDNDDKKIEEVTVSKEEIKNR